MFSREFIASGLIEAETGRLGQQTQALREQADYEAEEFAEEEALRVLAEAERFVTAVERVLGRFVIAGRLAG
jgi:uncharacterized protein (UPF0332 family)